MTLKNSSYNAKLVYKTMDEIFDVNNSKNDRARKILWFTSPYNMTIANKLREEFFRLLKKNFPLLSTQYKIFN